MQDQFKDLKSKIVLLNFSLTHCPPEEIQQILKERSVLEVEVCRNAWIFLSDDDLCLSEEWKLLYMGT